MSEDDLMWMRGRSRAAMSFVSLPFASAGWTTGMHPLERKKLVADPPIALIEFAPGFEDPSWCECGYVV